MKFSDFSTHLEKLEKTSSRLAITDEVVKILSKLSADEVSGAVYILLGRLEPSYTGLEFNLGWKMTLEAIGKLTEVEKDKMLSDLKKKGDMGEVIMGLPSKYFKGKGLTVKEVYERLLEIARFEGEGSSLEKVDGLAKLLSDLDQVSAKFVARIVLGHLRLGFSDKTILDALSVFEKGDKSVRKMLDEAYQITPDAGLLASRVISMGTSKALSNLEIKAGVPVMSALCQRLNETNEIIEKMGEVAAEAKYDGTRVQIHFSKKGFPGGSNVRSFTRNLEENSHMFPELLKLASYLMADEIVLDAEAVGIDTKNGKILPFQMTITRKRKHGVEEAAAAVPLRFYVFDILAKNGKTLLSLPYFQRREILSETIRKNETFVVDEMHRTTDAAELHKWHEKFLAEGFEGAVVKKWDGAYLPGRQGWNWVKIKESEGSTGKLSDTMDLVVMGYYRGRGKRTDFGLGAFLVGARKGEEIVTIAKVGTGLSDEDWKGLKARLDNLESGERPKNYQVSEALIPDVWVRPKVVVEVAADELTNSPNHTAGVALRFPRLVKFRDDKGLDGVTTMKEIGTINIGKKRVK